MQIVQNTLHRNGMVYSIIQGHTNGSVFILSHSLSLHLASMFCTLLLLEAEMELSLKLRERFTTRGERYPLWFCPTRCDICGLCNSSGRELREKRGSGTLKAVTESSHVSLYCRENVQSSL